MASNTLNKGDFLCVPKKGRAGNNGESSWRADHDLGMKNNLSRKDE
jgi:hypothetical protein